MRTDTNGLTRHSAAREMKKTQQNQHCSDLARRSKNGRIERSLRRIAKPLCPYTALNSTVTAGHIQRQRWTVSENATAFVETACFARLVNNIICALSRTLVSCARSLLGVARTRRRNEPVRICSYAPERRRELKRIAATPNLWVP